MGSNPTRSAKQSDLLRGRFFRASNQKSEPTRSLLFLVEFRSLLPKIGKSFFRRVAEVAKAGSHIVPGPGGIGFSEFIIAYDFHQVHLIVFNVVVNGEKISLFVFPVAVSIPIDKVNGNVQVEGI